MLAGYPLVDVEPASPTARYHEVDSSEMAFKIAGSMALKEAVRKAGAVAAGARSWTSRSSRPRTTWATSSATYPAAAAASAPMTARGNSQVMTAHVPLAEMFGYATDLRSKTQGRATYTMQFAGYEQVPGASPTEIVAKVRGE